jgi:hypothetical protein
MTERVIKAFGPFWARNEKNLEVLRKEPGNKPGFYILYCGWQPVYVGQGRLYKRIKKHTTSRTKTWDRFTWFEVDSVERAKEMEAILLRSLPFYLRVYNNQGAHIEDLSSSRQKDGTPLAVELPKMTPNKHRRKQAKSK